MLGRIQRDEEAFAAQFNKLQEFIYCGMFFFG